MKSKIPLRSVLSASTFWLLLVTFPASLAAQANSSGSSFVFPRFVSCNNANSGIAIVNPSAWDATVVLTLTNGDGSAGTTQTISVPAHGQGAIAASQLVGNVCADAWLEATSTTVGLIAYYQAFNTQLTYMDGTDSSATALNLFFPVVPRSAEGIAEIDLLNQTPWSTAVELSLWGLDGTLLGKIKVQVPAQGVYRNLVQNIFPAGTDLSNASHITAVAKPVNLFGQAQMVSGTSLLAGFSSVASTAGNYDVAALNALTLDQASNSGAIPYFRTGSQYSSTISVANIESVAVDVTLTAIDNGGNNLGSTKISLKGNGGYRALVQSVFPSIGSSAKEGWILVSANGRVYATTIHGASDTPSLSAVPMQKIPTSGFVFPQVLQGAGYSSELTLVNPSSSATSAQVFVVNSDGTTLASNQVAIPANGRVRQTLGQIMPEISVQQGGFVYVQGGPLFSTMAITANNGVTTASFAPELVSIGYSPAPLSAFAVTGTVTLNDQPAGGFRIALSGPTSQVTTSASDGTYAFTGLAPGNYSMMVDQYGFQFIPAQTNFTLATSSLRQNFQGYTTNNSIVIQPSAMPVGSTDTTAIVYGLNFDSTSQAFVGPTRLSTTLIDSSQLQIVIPAYMMVSASEYSIYVVTDNIATQPCPFVAFLDAPTLTSITSPGNIAEGNPGTVITLNGTGFLQDATVEINGLSSGIQVTVVNSTQILAYVPGSYLQQGGIYPVTVVNPYPANIQSNVQLLTVYYPAPGINAVVPASLVAELELGAAPVNLEIQGYGFTRGAVVLFNGKTMATTYCETDAYCLATQIYAIVPASELQNSGFAEIEVQNPTPTLGTSQSVTVPIYGLEPSITSVLPGSATLLDMPGKYIVPIVVSGINFGPQTLVMAFPANGAPTNFGSPDKILSSTQLTLNLEIDDYASSLGDWIIQVMNPQPGGGMSDQAIFTLTAGTYAGNPFIISMNPTIVSAGGPAFTLTINGTNLESGAQVQFNMAMLNTTFVSDMQLTVNVPAYLIQRAGSVPICVINPDTGGASNRLYLDIR